MSFLLDKGHLCEEVVNLEHLKGIKAMTRGNEAIVSVARCNRLHCPRDVSGLMVLFFMRGPSNIVINISNIGLAVGRASAR